MREKKYVCLMENCKGLLKVVTAYRYVSKFEGFECTTCVAQCNKCNNIVEFNL